jgi:hypothetical protein
MLPPRRAALGLAALALAAAAAAPAFDGTIYNYRWVFWGFFLPEESMAKLT